MSILLQFVIHCTYHILVRHSVTETAIFMIHWYRWLHQNCTMIDVVWENWNDVTYKNRLMIQPFQCTNRETDGRTDGRTSNNIGLYSEYCHSNSMHTLTVSYLRRSLLAGLRLPFRKNAKFVFNSHIQWTSKCDLFVISTTEVTVAHYGQAADFFSLHVRTSTTYTCAGASIPMGQGGMSPQYLWRGDIHGNVPPPPIF